jgi:hypothetical protein
MIKDYMLLQRRPHGRDQLEVIQLNWHASKSWKFKSWSGKEYKIAENWNRLIIHDVSSYLQFLRAIQAVRAVTDTNDAIVNFCLSITNLVSAPTFVLLLENTLASGVIVDVESKTEEVCKILRLVYGLTNKLKVVPTKTTRDDWRVMVIVNTYSKCGNWALVLEVFYERKLLNMIACNSVIVSFSLKAQNESVVDMYRWMESEEMPPDSSKSTQNQNDLIKQFAMVIVAHLELELDNLGKAVSVKKSLFYLPNCSRVYSFLTHIYEAETLWLFIDFDMLKRKLQLLVLSSIYVWCVLHEHMRIGPSIGCIYPKQESSYNEGIMSLCCSVSNGKWESGELNFPKTATICDYCWSDLLIFHGLLNFVFDRGKVLMDTHFNLEDKVVLKGWVLLET